MFATLSPACFALVARGVLLAHGGPGVRTRFNEGQPAGPAFFQEPLLLFSPQKLPREEKEYEDLPHVVKM